MADAEAAPSSDSSQPLRRERWSLLLAPLFEAALWPLVTIALLAPQRRAPDPDQNRPL